MSERKDAINLWKYTPSRALILHVAAAPGTTNVNPSLFYYYIFIHLRLYEHDICILAFFEKTSKFFLFCALLEKNNQCTPSQVSQVTLYNSLIMG